MRACETGQQALRGLAEWLTGARRVDNRTAMDLSFVDFFGSNIGTAYLRVPGNQFGALRACSPLPACPSCCASHLTLPRTHRRLALVAVRGTRTLAPGPAASIDPQSQTPAEVLLGEYCSDAALQSAASKPPSLMNSAKAAQFCVLGPDGATRGPLCHAFNVRTVGTRPSVSLFGPQVAPRQALADAFAGGCAFASHLVPRAAANLFLTSAHHPPTPAGCCGRVARVARLFGAGRRAACGDIRPRQRPRCSCRRRWSGRLRCQALRRLHSRTTASRAARTPPPASLRRLAPRHTCMAVASLRSLCRCSGRRPPRARCTTRPSPSPRSVRVRAAGSHGLQRRPHRHRHVPRIPQRQATAASCHNCRRVQGWRACWAYTRRWRLP